MGKELLHHHKDRDSFPDHSQNVTRDVRPTFDVMVTRSRFEITLFFNGRTRYLNFGHQLFTIDSPINKQTIMKSFVLPILSLALLLASCGTKHSKRRARVK